MKPRPVLVGIFVTVVIVLFGTGLFLIGNQHKAFRRHTRFYTEFANVDGVGLGLKVRVSGSDAGQVQGIQIPSSPAHKFRLEMQVDDSLRGLVRRDSVVTIETEGVVGDKFLLIHSGSDRAAAAPAGATLLSKEPTDLGKLLDQAGGLLNQVQGTLNQAQGTIADVQQQLDGTLHAVTATVNNANGMVTDVRNGKGAAGVLLANPQTAQDVQQAVANARNATAQLNNASGEINRLLTDVQQRQLVAKTDATIQHAQGATEQLQQVSQQVNTTLAGAFARDQYGQDAGSNLQQSLTNINAASGNLADDTEALQHEFFFKGFFKSRGYNNLNNLPADQYRSGQLFKKLEETRQWLSAGRMFEAGPNGAEQLSAGGRAQLDGVVSQMQDVYSQPILVEGYAQSGTPAEQLLESRLRATLVRSYLELHYHVQPKNTGVVALSATPPASAGKPSWDGVCLVRLSKAK